MKFGAAGGLVGAGGVAGGLAGVFCVPLLDLDALLLFLGVVSARASIKTPLTESTVETVATFWESAVNETVMFRAVT